MAWFLSVLLFLIVFKLIYTLGVAVRTHQRWPLGDGVKQAKLYRGFPGTTSPTRVVLAGPWSGKGVGLTPPCVTSLASPHRPKASADALEPRRREYL